MIVGWRTLLIAWMGLVGWGAGVTAGEPFRLGIIGLDTSHAVAFTRVFNADTPPDDLAERELLAGLRVVAATPLGSLDIVSSTSRRAKITADVAALGVEIVDSIEMLLPRVDGVLLETNDGRPHLAQARQVIAAGKPLFVDKPVAASLADVLTIYRLAAEAKVPIFSSSTLRFAPAAAAVRGGSVGRVLGCDAASPCAVEPTHPDLFWYGIHGVETLFTCMGTGCEAVRRSHTPTSDLVVGRWSDGRLGSFRGMREGKQLYGGRAYGRDGTAELGPPAGYRPLVVEIARFFRTGKPPVSPDETIEIYAFMEAAHESTRRGGAEVRLEEVMAEARRESDAAARRRPNILFIVADDLGWSDVGWHGGFGKTPRLDRLVAEGVEFDRHYVQPVCTPTRVALLTGRYPGRFGPHAIAPSNLRALPPGTPTLASALQACGYATFLAGKWHLGSRPEWGPLAYGFDHAYGTLTGAADPWTHLYRRGPYEDTWHRDGTPLQETGNVTELITAEAVQRIRAAAGQAPRRPWFLYVPFHVVHAPVDAPAEFLRLYEGVVFHDDPVLDESRRRMAAMVSQLDASVGAMIDALDETDQRRDTLVVFCSDNGGLESVKNPYVGTVADSPLNSENDPLRDQKNTLYEGGIRVCGFANWPGRLPARRCAAAVHVADWFPTLAGLVGYQPPEDPHWDGVDRWAAITGPEDLPRERPIVIVHGTGRAVIDGRWKLIVGKKGTRELYDLEADPGEHDDRSSREPAVVERLTAVARGDAERDRSALPPDLVGLPK